MSLPKPLQHLKDYWPLWGIVVAVATALTTYVGLPKRVQHIEAGQATLEETFQEYLQEQKEAVAEQRGYQKALNETIKQQQAQPPSAPRPSNRTLPPSPSRASQEWVEQDAEGTCWSCWAETKDACWLDDPTTEAEDNFWRRCE